MTSRLRGSWAFDGVLTAVLLVFGLVALVTYHPADGVEYRHPDVLGAAFVLAVTLPLLFRRVAPLTVGLVLAGSNLLALAWTYSIPTAAVATLLACYSLGAYAGLTRGLVGLSAIGTTTAGFLLVTALRYPDADGAGGVALAFAAIGLFGTWAIGRSVRATRMYARHLEDRARQLERTREAEVRAALAEERGQIARELHDVVAHHVSVMTVQAAGARRSLDRQPDRSREALEAIETTGRSALAEMRRVVGVLRGRPPGSAASAAADRSPRPGLADLPDLVDQLAATGLPVAVNRVGEHTELPLGVDLAAYRVIQEALTNTLRHAGGSPATVTVSYSPAELLVEVTDDGPGSDHAGGANRGPGGRPGHGLLGMRERVSLYGGELHTGPRPEGGYRVRARIPLRDAT